MHSIPIYVSGKVAICPKRYLISSNSDYVLDFTFDGEWDAAPVKTARVIFDDQCLDLVFSGTSVALPRIPPCAALSVGVYSDALASTAAELGCILSVADGDETVLDPLTETQYTQLFAILNALEARVLASLSLAADTLTATFSDSSTQSVSLASLRGAALLPAVTANDDGKIAAVENGVWTTARLEDWMDNHFLSYCSQFGVAADDAEGVSF